MYSVKTVEHQNTDLNQIIIENKDQNFQAEVYPNLGASLQKYSLDSIDVIDGITNNEKGLEVYKSKYNSSFLFPFPSRIPNGEYSFNGNDYQVNLNEPALGNALHGHIAYRTFKLDKYTASNENAVLYMSYINNGDDKGYPFSYKIELTYSFSINELEISFNVSNIGNDTLPFGIGWHPYFKTPNLNNATLNFDADSQIFFNKKMQPEGEQPLKYKFPFKIEEHPLDDGFILKNPNATFNTDLFPVRISFSSEAPNSFLQVYTPPHRESIAVEPMTCAPNCFNNKKGLQSLEAGRQYDWNVKLDFNKY